MPILNIRDLGTVGVNTDIAPWELPPSALSAGINFRMSSGKIQSAGGIVPIGPDTGDEMGHITPTKNFDLQSKWIVMGKSSIKLFNAGAYTVISNNLSFSGLDETKWSSCRIGRVTFMNHPDIHPIYWVDQAEGDGIAQAEWLPWHAGSETWAQAGMSCRVIASHKNFLFALGMKEQTAEYRDKVWWSHPAEPDGIPFSWRITAEQPDSIAGYVSLGRGGAIVGGESLRDSFIIYSEDAINSLEYVGDALGWRRRTVSSSADLVGKEAVVEVKGVQYFISRSDIMMFDGNQMQSLLHNRLRSRLAASINSDTRHRSWAAHNQSFNEIWFAVPETLAEFPTAAIVYNYRDNTLAIRDLEQEIKHGQFGDEPSDVGNLTWDTMTNDWDSDRGSWGMAGERPFKGALLGVTGTQIVDVDPGFSESADDTRTPTVITRQDLPIGGHEANTTITRIYPLVEGTAPLEIRVGSAQRAGGPIRWAGDFRTFVPGVDRKIDVRTTGETHAYEIRSKGGAFFDLTGMDIEFSPAGGR